MAEHDVAGGLIDALGRGGEAVDAGQFTLDAAAAFAKLRAHQLDDPHAYLLVLVEAGWLAGHGRSEGGVAIRTGATTVVEFRGLTPDHAALPDLFAAALGRIPPELEGDDRTRARILRLLGLAANAALALAPKSVVLESIASDGRRTRIRIEPTGDVVVVEAAAADLDGPCPHPGGRLRFELHGRESTRDRVAAERALVRERCAYTTFEVRLDDELCSRSPASFAPVPDALPNSGPRTRTSIRDPHDPIGQVIGVAEHSSDPAARSAARIVNRGVAIHEPLERFDHGVRAIVEVDLPVDLSRKQLLEGPELDAVRAAIRVAVRDLATPRAAEPGLSTARRTSAWSIGITLVLGILGATLIERCFVAGEEAELAEAEAAIARWREDNPSKAEQAMADAEAILGATRIDVGALVHACERDGADCLSAAVYTDDPAQRDRLLLRGCAARDPDACEALVDHARDHARASHNPSALGLALAQSCRGVPGPDCLEAARHLERGDYPDAKTQAQPYYRQRQVRGLGWDTELGAVELRQLGCEAGVADACAR